MILDLYCRRLLQFVLPILNRMLRLHVRAQIPIIGRCVVTEVAGNPDAQVGVQVAFALAFCPKRFATLAANEGFGRVGQLHMLRVVAGFDGLVANLAGLREGCVGFLVLSEIKDLPATIRTAHTDFLHVDTLFVTL